MVKRGFLVGAILLLVSLLLIGCGVPKEDYEAVVAERDSTIAERDSALAELQSVKTQLNTAQAEVSDLNSKLEKRQQQLSDFQEILDSLEPKLQMQQLLAEYGNKQAWYKLPKSSLTWSEWRHFARHEFRIDMEKYLEAVDDRALRILYEDAYIWEEEGWTTDHEDVDELVTLLGELIEADRNKLREALAD